ncbi:GntR family transcriptional regulator [Seohaeicola saemankumensis]|nr:GntR family transcriptional regulator [Seohaeicola saemankumensis]MCA0869426.1 GntR family transcriptional regulator [Seohaeicola saemankumensis]
MNDGKLGTYFDLYGDTPVKTAHVPASKQVYDEVRARIVSLDWPPGTVLSRSELATAFGVSQSPIREAIQRLEQVDLVVSYRQSRTEVTRINPARLRQEHFLRTALECEVVHVLADLADKTVLTKAKGLLKMQEALADDLSQVELFRKLDEDFHRELFIAAGQEALHGHVADRSSQMARLRSLDLPRGHKLHSVLEGHNAVMAAIEAGTPNAAADEMRRHLSGTIERLPDIMAENRDFFL